MNSSYSQDDAVQSFYQGLNKAKKARRRRQIATQLAFRGTQNRVMEYVTEPPINHELPLCECGHPPWKHVRGLSSQCRGENL